VPLEPTADAPTWRLRVWTRFLAPAQDVWAYKTSLVGLRTELSPLRLVIADPQGMERALAQGRPGHFQARLVPPGVAWPIDLVEVEPGRLFADHSDNALFSRFEHRHLVEPTPDGARYVDDLLLSPRGPLRGAILSLTVRLFQHRHRRAARDLPHDPRVCGITVLREQLAHERPGAAPPEEPAAMPPGDLPQP